MALSVNISQMKQWWSLILIPGLIPRSWHTSLSVDILCGYWGPVWSTSLSSWSLWSSSPIPAPLSTSLLSPVLYQLLFPPNIYSSVVVVVGELPHQCQLPNLQPNTVDLRTQTSIPHPLPTETQPPNNGIPLNGVNKRLLCIWGKMPWCWWHLNSCRCHCSIWRHIILPFISRLKPDSAQ